MIALFLLCLAGYFWRLSFKTDDRLEATARWCAAVVLLLMAVVAGLVMLVG